MKISNYKSLGLALLAGVLLAAAAFQLLESD